MNVKEYLAKVAYVVEEEDELTPLVFHSVYRSNFDGSYITLVGMEQNVAFLASLEVTEELTHGVGFSSLNNQWFGWSHRAYYGFGIGSTCKKGDLHYIGSTIQEQQDDAIEFWSDENRTDVRCEGIVEENGEKYFCIKWTYTDQSPAIMLRGSTDEALMLITPLGRGEWVAKTMEDAKQMAIDFNAGVR